MPDPDPNNPDPKNDPNNPGDQKFTQADVNAAVDKIAAGIRAEERRKAAEKYADYDELKAQAAGAKTLEDRIAELEAKGSAVEVRALRAEIASEFGISTKKGPKGEASDADLFLTGNDEASMRAQAERLAANEKARKKAGNHVPGEGDNPKPGQDGGMRDFTRKLFGRDDD